MPTYQYACTACDERLEVVQKFTDDPLTTCEVCGGSLRKVYSPVGIVFKGSGFYRTDSRAGGRRGGSRDKEPAKDGAASGNGSSGDSDSKGSKSEKTKDSKESKDAKDAKTSTDSKPTKSAGSKRDTSSK